MNEENQMISAREGGLSPSVQSQNSNGLGSIQDSGFKRNSSLELFELANAEKNRAKEMQYENEVMKAKAEQQRLAGEANSIRQSGIDSEIISALNSGKIDKTSADLILNDNSIGQNVKDAIINAFYPSYGSYN